MRSAFGLLKYWTGFLLPNWFSVIQLLSHSFPTKDSALVLLSMKQCTFLSQNVNIKEETFFVKLNKAIFQMIIHHTNLSGIHGHLGSCYICCIFKTVVNLVSRCCRAWQWTVNYFGRIGAQWSPVFYCHNKFVEEKYSLKQRKFF